MAQEITMELALRIPGCSIMYAPSSELATWILKRRALDLVVSSPILPDGGIAKLRETLERIKRPPALLVVGELRADVVAALNGSVYKCTALKRYPSGSVRTAPKTEAGKAERPPKIQRAIANLGADIRNDLNNPLQEIVAMVFVAQAAGDSQSASTDQALSAIDRAAKNMAEVVSKLEDKIRNAVEPHISRGSWK